jgi:hypothetical protein
MQRLYRTPFHATPLQFQKTAIAITQKTELVVHGIFVNGFPIGANKCGNKQQ